MYNSMFIYNHKIILFIVINTINTFAHQCTDMNQCKNTFIKPY